MININEGRTNNYLVHGIGVLLLCLIFFGMSFLSNLFFIPLVLLFVFAILLFTATNGIEIDVDQSQFRKYGKIARWKFGAWHAFTKPVSVELNIYAENAFKEGMWTFGNSISTMPGSMQSLNSKARTYDIVFIDKDNKSQLIYSFLDYKKGKDALKRITEKLEITSVNRIAEKMNSRRRR